MTFLKPLNYLLVNFSIFNHSTLTSFPNLQYITKFIFLIRQSNLIKFILFYHPNQSFFKDIQFNLI